MHRHLDRADRGPPAAHRQWPLRRRPALSRHARSGIRAQPARACRDPRHRYHRGAPARAGIHAVLTLADLAPFLAQERLPLQFRTAQLPPDVTPLVLAKNEVAFVGEAVAVVIAESRYVAEDAAALVVVDYEPLPAVSDCRQALEPTAPRTHRSRASNLLLEFRQSYGDVTDAFARAAHRVRVALKQHRGGAHSIEGRGAIAAYDANEDRLTLWSSTQLAHEVRAFLMLLLRPRREPNPRRGAGCRRRLRRQVRDVSGGSDACRRLPAAAPAAQMDRRPPRAFSRRGPGARSILGPGSRLRR